jgi:hypothetical protein
VVGGLVALVGAAALGWWAYAGHYQPLVRGSLWAAPPPMEERSTAFGDAVALVGPAGTKAYVIQSVRNDGRASVRITGAELAGPASGSARWVPLPHGGCCPTGPGAWRAFPATVAPHEEIGLVIPLRQPRCDPPGASRGLEVLPVRFTALGVRRRADIALQMEVADCGSDSG